MYAIYILYALFAFVIVGSLSGVALTFANHKKAS